MLVRLGCLAAGALLAPSLLQGDTPRVPARPVQCPLPGPGEPPFVGPPPAFPAAPPGYGGPAAAGPVDPPTPVVAIRVRVPANATPGQELEYRIEVENTSRAAAYHVRVRNPLPQHATYVRATPEPKQTAPELQWEFDQLPAGARKEIVLVLKPDGTGDVTSCARVRFEHGQCVTTRLNRPGLQARKTGPAQGPLNDIVTFRIDVTNNGRAPAADVAVTDTLPDGLEFVDSKPPTNGTNPLTWKLGTLGPGQSRQVEYQAVLKRTGTFTNKAVVEAAGGLRQEATSTITVGEPKLTLTKSGPGRRLVNRPTPYLLTVSNPGDMAAEHVEVIDEVPDGIRFDSASAGGVFVPRRPGARLDQVKWSLGTLAPGTSRTLQVVLHATAAGEFVNVATATADRGLTEKARAQTKFENAAGVSVEIDKSADPVAVGQDVTYTLRLLNPGKETAKGVALVFTAPDELKVSAARGPMPAERDGQTARFAPLPSLAPGAEAVYTVSAQAVKAGAARVRLEVTSAEAGATPLKWEETTTIQGPAPGAKAPSGL